MANFQVSLAVVQNLIYPAEVEDKKAAHVRVSLERRNLHDHSNLFWASDQSF